MNERIKELMVKAGIEIKSRRPYIDEEPDGYLESDNDFFLNNHDTIIRLLEEGGLERFAELIVEECRNVVTELYRNTPLELCGPLITADEKIAEHFYGVEE